MSRLVRWRKLIPVASLAVAVVFSTGLLQGQSSDRAKRLGGKLVCMCGCAEGLTACDHVNCPLSGPMIKELDKRVTANDSDDLILQSFVQEYGEAVLAEPPTRGFNSLAWFIPGIAFALGLGVVVVVIRQWRHRLTAAPVARPAVSAEFLERARRQADRETEE